MRSIAFMPLTFVAGVEGFGWFVGYLAAIFMILEIRRIVKTWKPAYARVQHRTPVAPPDFDLEIIRS